MCPTPHCRVFCFIHMHLYNMTQGKDKTLYTLRIINNHSICVTRDRGVQYCRGSCYTFGELNLNIHNYTASPSGLIRFLVDPSTIIPEYQQSCPGLNRYFYTCFREKIARRKRRKKIAKRHQNTHLRLKHLYNLKIFAKDNKSHL